MQAEEGSQEGVADIKWDIDIVDTTEEATTRDALPAAADAAESTSYQGEGLAVRIAHAAGAVRA